MSDDAALRVISMADGAALVPCRQFAWLAPNPNCTFPNIGLCQLMEYAKES
jgi:hypothetical protein